MDLLIQRTLPIGAEICPEGGVSFRVWAPDSAQASIELFSEGPEVGETVALQQEKGGYFSGVLINAKAGSLYKVRLDSGSFPDPASRFQPEGPHGPSQVWDASNFPWTDGAWRGLPVRDLVIYELHIGTYTAAGTWRAAMEHLPELKRVGITLIEIMPIGDFSGQFGWGYDGVDLFAPTRLYGTPDDLRAFVDRAHQLGLMVILDVVYNHLGPDGNYLCKYSKEYFSTEHPSEWGQALNFEGENSGPIREFFISNAGYWIGEFHLDGLRMDATQQIFDRSPVHILAEVAKSARDAGTGRAIYIVGENERQECRLVRSPERGGYGLDALWNDDYHHSAIVAATGRREAYYLDYKGTAQEFISVLKHGFLYQGQWNWRQRIRRGSPAFDLDPKAFVIFLENHDQVANSLRGARLHQLTGAAQYRALTALTLLAPSTPLLFQGQEFGASTPFLYFSDHPPQLQTAVTKGRIGFLSQFRTLATKEALGLFGGTDSAEAFRRCKLDHSERSKNPLICTLVEDLLRLRREDGAITNPDWVDGAVLSEHAFVVRYFSGDGNDRLLIVNLGPDLYCNPAPEPLLAPSEGRGWHLAWSSESLRYGGGGAPSPETTENWIILGHSAILMVSGERHDPSHARLLERD